MQFTLVGNEDGTENLTVFVEGQAPLAAHSSHPNYSAIKAGAINLDDSIIDLFDVAMTAGTKFSRLTERITAANGRLYLDGEEVHDALADQVVRFLQEGVDDWKPLVAFFENVQSNPNDHSKAELYMFLTKNNMTITEDGLIVGYKSLLTTETKGVYKSSTEGKAIVDDEIFEGQIPQCVGSVVEMPRSEVIWEPNYACHIGLHVGNYDMAARFLGEQSHVVLEVHVHPRDVVSVPTSGEKMRVCRYKAVRVAKEEISKAVVPAAKKTNAKNTVSKKIKDAKAEVKEVRVGDVYEDTDKRRAGRKLKVISVSEGKAGLQDAKSTGIKKVETVISTERLQSRKYKLVKRGRKK